MTESQPQDTSTFKLGRLFALILFVGMAAAIAYLYGRQNPSASQDEETAAMRAELQNARELILQLKEADLHRQRDQQLAQSRLAGSRRKLDDTADTIDRLDKAVQSWKQTTADLQTSPDGMRLAANPAALDQYEALLEAERAPETLSRELRERLLPLLHFRRSLCG